MSHETGDTRAPSQGGMTYVMKFSMTDDCGNLRYNAYRHLDCSSPFSTSVNQSHDEKYHNTDA